MVAVARDALPMHYSDLDLSAQLGLLMLVVVLSTGFLMRTLVFFRFEIDYRESAGRLNSI